MEKLTMEDAVAKEAKRISRAFRMPESEASRLLKRTAVYQSSVLSEQAKTMMDEISKGLKKLLK